MRKINKLKILIGMSKFKIITLILVVVSLKALAQETEKNDIDFVVNKIKYTYAGYKDKIKGNEFEDLIKKVRITTSKDTFAQLAKLTSYFQDIHLGLYQIYWPDKIDTNQCKINYASINVRTKKNESFWIDDLNQNVICLRKENNNDYAGYLVESKRKVPLGLCILKFRINKKQPFLADVIDLEEYYRAFMKSFFTNDNVLMIKGYKKWTKIENYNSRKLESSTTINNKPFFKILDTNNVLLNMPSFSRYYIPIYDSIVKANKNLIGETKNLIIDLRNNRGGVIGNFYSLFPFLGKNVIMEGGYSSLSSDDLVKNFNNKKENYLKQKDTAMAKAYDDYVKRLIENKNNFIFNKSDTFSVNQIDSFPKLKNIAIITNNSSVSSAELMLLFFKQSNKVKVFGEVTGGVVDYLDEMRFQTPFSKFNLFVPTTKREITALFPAYDMTGIKPDIQISDNEPDWIDFVKRYYEKK
jgi:uncharacterized lipoprotein YehR (DUF1307 family)